MENWQPGYGWESGKRPGYGRKQCLGIVVKLPCSVAVTDLLDNLLKTQPKLLPKNLTFRPLSEAFIRRHNVPVAMKPYKTLKTVLVHPKDKQEKEDLTECVYKVPCANCDKTYIGETGRKFGVRLQEHRTEVESKTGRTFTRSLRASMSRSDYLIIAKEINKFF